MKKTKNRMRLMSAIIGIFIVALLTACAQQPAKQADITETKSPAESPEVQPSTLPDEGVDTEILITGYTEYSGANKEMFLREGDKVAVISPSATPTREQTDATIEGLKKCGYVPVEGKYACVEGRTLQNCLDDLTWALEDPEIKAIYCVRGGYAASEVMDKIALDQIKNARKLIIGYSDISIYHAAWTSSGLPSVHASMSATFMDLPAKCVEPQEKLMQGQVPSYKCAANEYCKEGSAKGILIGGNLSTFTACLGTEYDPTRLGKPYILFLEEVDEDIQHNHRSLTILKHMGVLDNAQAIIFGEWTEVPANKSDYNGKDRGGEFSSTADMISRQFAADLDIPVAYGFPAGHGEFNYPLLMGEEATLTVNQESFTLEWK